MRPVFVTFKRWFLVVLIALLIMLYFTLELNQYLHYETLRLYHISLHEWTDQHYLLSVVLYLLIFTLLIACTIPCATILTLLGGFLFGSIAILYSIFATTLGGLILLIAVRTAFGVHIASPRYRWIKRLETGFQDNAFFYLLTLRLIPVAPCWVSNIAAGALNVPIRTFIAATVIGVTPASTVFALAGRGLGAIFSAPGTPELNMLAKPAIFIPLIGLALLSIFPVLIKKFIIRR